MKSVFYIIKVDLDAEEQPIPGSEEAIGLLIHPEALQQAIEKWQAHQETRINSPGNRIIN